MKLRNRNAFVNEKSFLKSEEWTFSFLPSFYIFNASSAFYKPVDLKVPLDPQWALAPLVP